MALEEGVAPNVEDQNVEERHVNISGLFRRPEKYRIGEDFDLFFRKSVLYFDAIDVTDERKKRLALLFNLSEDAFRLAEGVPLPECQNSFDAWGKEIATRFEKNQTATERRYTFSKRIQLPGETVDAYSVSLRALAAKCDFRGSDYNNRVLDQFILGLQDKGTQNRLLQEPPSTVDEAIAVARRYEAARSTLDTLKQENLSRSSVVNPVRSGKTCFVCHNPGHVARDCTHERYNVEKVSPNNKLCFYCKQTGHIQHHCPFKYNRDRFRNTTEQERQREVRICFRCNKRGHVAKYCRANWEEINSGLSSSQPLSKEQGRNVSKLSSIAGSEKRTTLVLEGIIEGSRVLCVLDTGASICLMSKEKWNKLSLSKELLPSDVVAEAANNMPLGILGRSILQFECAGIGFEQEFYIVEHMAHEILIGLNWMLENKVDLQVGARKLLFGNGNSCDLFLYDSSFMYPGVVSLCEDLEVPAGHEVICPANIGNPFVDECILEPNGYLSEKGLVVARVVVSPVHQIVPVQLLNPTKESVKLKKGTVVGYMEGIDIDPHDSNASNTVAENDAMENWDFSHLEKDQHITMERFLQENRDIFARDLMDIGLTNKVEHHIDTGNAAPIKQLPRRLPHVLKQVVDTQFQQMLETDVIEPSNSPWASPIVLVKKRDGSWRFCIDFRKLNDVTRKDAYPIPQVFDLIDSLSGNTFFTTLDLKSGYWQVPVHADSKPKTAFVIPGGGHFQFKRMAFGLTNAVPTFQRLMMDVLSGMIGKKCLVYLDDVLVLGRTLEEHLSNLKDVFDAIREAGLKLNGNKCVFAQPSVRYLGYVISAQGIAPDEEKVKAVEQFPVPEDVVSLRRFLGIVGYYRRFICGFGDIAAPLFKLLQKDSKFEWKQSCTEAFQALKESLIKAPVMSYPRFDREFIVYTDASNIGVGGVLSQRDDHGHEKVIAYASRTFHGSERNWSTTEKEAYAIVWSLDYFSAYIFGQKVIVYSDHRALQWLRNIKVPNGKLARWLLRLEEFDYEVIHKPGHLMQHVDALSRAPVDGIVISGWTREEFEELQSLDEDIAIVSNWVAEGQKPEEKPVQGSEVLLTFHNIFDSLSLKDGLLCRRWIDETGEENHQIVVPQFFKGNVLREIHLSAGHSGISKTFASLQSRYYWPKFFTDVQAYCKSCEVCARNKTAPRPRWPLQPIEIKPIPFYIVGVDIIGPLKTTKSGNRYILTVIDYFTKFAEAEPLRNQEAETVVRALERIFASHGMPSILLTDQGSNFQSHLMKSMCELFGIEKRRTTPYHPQSDGLCERFNGILKSLLRMLVNKSKDNWDDQIPMALLAYRSTKQSSTGVSPFEMLYGRVPKLPAYVESKTEFRQEKDPIRYIDELRDKQQTLRQFVNSKLKSVQNKQKKAYDERFRTGKSKRLMPGDTVMLLDNTSRGLSEKYIGPFMIVDIVNSNCQIRSLLNGKEKRVHYNRLKPFELALDEALLQESASDITSDLESSDSENKEEHVIIHRRDRRNDFVLPDDMQMNSREPEIAFVERADENIVDLPKAESKRTSTRSRRPVERYGVSVTDY